MTKEQLEWDRIFNVPHPLTNFEIQKYYQNGPKFNGLYSRKNLIFQNLKTLDKGWGICNKSWRICKYLKSLVAIYVKNDVATYCALCEKCPNTELFLVHIFLYSVQIRENKDQKKLNIWILFMEWWYFWCWTYY